MAASLVTTDRVSCLATGLISVIVLLFALSVAAVVLRVVSVNRLHRKWKVHDFLSFLSLFCLVGYCTAIIVGIYHGSFGLPITQVEPSRLMIAFKTFFASQFFWSAGVTSFRVAIILLYIEIFQCAAFFWTATITASVVVTYYVACVITILAECHPISFNWDRSTPGTCANTTAVAIFSAAWNMAVDIWVVCLPLPIVWDLNMPTKRKFAISATFALGFAIVGLNLARLLVTLRCDQANFTYCVVPEYMIVIGEMSVGVVVTCVPTFGPVFFPRRVPKTCYQINENSKPRNKQFNSRRNPPGQSVLTTTINEGEGSFHALEEDDIELNRAVHVGNGVQVSRGNETECLNDDFIPGTIDVKDLSVVGTSRTD